ncbi:MAG: hypothetical protein WBC49_07010, partial [Thermoplasmata archaeon]
IDYHMTSPLTDDMHPTRPKPEELERKRISDAAKAEARALRANERGRGPPMRRPRRPRVETKPAAKAEKTPEPAKPAAEKTEG